MEEEAEEAEAEESGRKSIAGTLVDRMRGAGLQTVSSGEGVRRLERLHT